MNPRRILGQVVEHQRLQPEEFLAGRVPIEIDLQARLVGVARAAAARADADVADGLAVPDQIGRVIGVGEEVFLELRPVRGVQFEVDPL